MTGKKGRAAGEGHVRWNETLGVYEARLYVPVKLRPLYGGKRVLPFYSKKESVALEKREAAKREMDEGRGRSKDLTFGTYLSRWVDALASLKTVSEATLSDYRYHAERHLIPSDKLGDIVLSDLTAEDLDLLYARLTKEGVGPRTVNHVHDTARVALQRAVKKRLIPFNPARAPTRRATLPMSASTVRSQKRRLRDSSRRRPGTASKHSLSWRSWQAHAPRSCVLWPGTT